MLAQTSIAEPHTPVSLCYLEQVVSESLGLPFRLTVDVPATACTFVYKSPFSQTFDSVSIRLSR
jgi:hypothetical protein